jgi:hypothetical protein
MLKPLDVAVLAWLIAEAPGGATQTRIAAGLGVAQSNVHRALAQLEASALVVAGKPQRGAFRELAVHALRYVYPPVLGAPSRGLPTAHSSPGLAPLLVAEQQLVWPLDGASSFGPALEPLHACVPGAAARSPAFYELMGVLDAPRVGRARERAAAERRLDALLGLA